jgi:integrase
MLDMSVINVCKWDLDAMTNRNRTAYLYQRPGSQNWYVRLQYPATRTRVEKSLGTPDRAHAEVLALPMIAEHKAKLFEARPGIQVNWLHRFAPGQEHTTPDGERVVANDRELIFLNHNGAILRTERNGEFAVAIPSSLREQRAIVRNLDQQQRQRNAANSDDALIETYLKHNNLAKYYEREARASWALYKQLTGNKPLKDATRDDGRKLVDYFEKQVLKSASIQKKITWLSAACNFAIDEGKLKFNPFSSIVRQRDDKLRRLPLDESDIRKVKQNLDRLDEAEALLLRVLACTGMRLSEAFEIDGEMKERGVRYVVIGRKTQQSLRRVPLPAGLLPLLPKKIEGMLFPASNPNAASKHLNKFLRDIGINDRSKVIHSLRHRAQDRLRAAGCPEDLRWAILGHEEKTIAAGYGAGFPVPLLRKWIDKIGF